MSHTHFSYGKLNSMGMHISSCRFFKMLKSQEELNTLSGRLPCVWAINSINILNLDDTQFSNWLCFDIISVNFWFTFTASFFASSTSFLNFSASFLGTTSSFSTDSLALASKVDKGLGPGLRPRTKHFLVPIYLRAFGPCPL